MRNIQLINRQLLKSEFDTGRAIFEAAKNDGFGSFQAAAIVYRHGYLDGKEEQRNKINELHSKLHILKQEAQQGMTAESEGIIVEPEGSEIDE